MKVSAPRSHIVIEKNTPVNFEPIVVTPITPSAEKNIIRPIIALWRGRGNALNKVEQSAG